MKALFVISGDYQNNDYLICPFCKHKEDQFINYDDYVDDNVMIWCDKGNYEFLICPSSLYPKNDVDIFLRKGNVNSECTIKLTYQEAIDYLKSIDYKDELEDIPNMYYYLVGVMNIKTIVQNSDLPDNYDDLNSDLAKKFCEEIGIKVDVTNFSQLPSNIDSQHDGCYLYYQACCTECNRETYSRIWGD